MIKTIVRPRYIEASVKNINPQIAEIINNSIKQRKGKSMYIHGDSGVGKTYAAYAIYNLVNENNLPCAVVRSLDIVDAIKTTFGGIPPVDSPHYEHILEMSEFLKELSIYKGLLIIDDIGSEKPSEGVVVKMFQIINDRYEWMYHTIYTSNLSLNELRDRIGDRIVGRIAEDCICVNLEGNNKRV